MKNAILSHLPGDFPWQVQYFESVDSTNTLAKKLAEQGAPHGTVIIAGQQTGGRGRMGRSFTSAPGKGIYLSVILRPACHARELMHLTCATAVATCNAIDKISGLRPGIKWVNDLIAKDKKLGGILTELSVDPSTGLVNYAIIGIGINCKAQVFPPELRDIAISLESATEKSIHLDAVSATLILSLWNMNEKLLTQKTELLAEYNHQLIL